MPPHSLLLLQPLQWDVLNEISGDVHLGPRPLREGHSSDSSFLLFEMTGLELIILLQVPNFKFEVFWHC